MANTKHYYFAGVCKWAMVHRMDEKYELYKIDLFMDESSFDTYNESGCTMKVKEDKESGDSFVTFRRKDQQLIGKDLKHFGKPKVVDKEGVPLTDNVGNGSSVVLKVAVFDTRNGIGHRLEGVMVTDLVPFEGGDSEDRIEEYRPTGLEDLPSF